MAIIPSSNASGCAGHLTPSVLSYFLLYVPPNGLYRALVPNPRRHKEFPLKLESVATQVSEGLDIGFVDHHTGLLSTSYS
jgi:hypothetical protein